MNDSSYPPDEAKWAMAKNVILEFPSLKAKIGQVGCVSISRIQHFLTIFTIICTDTVLFIKGISILFKNEDRNV